MTLPNILNALLPGRALLLLLGVMLAPALAHANVTGASFEGECLYSASIGQLIPVVTITLTFDGECVVDSLCYEDTGGNQTCIDLIASGVDLSNNSPSYFLVGLDSFETYAFTFYYGEENYGPVGHATEPCADEIPGCMDPSALNFDPEATFPVFSLCEFPCVNVVFTFITDCWGPESSWTLSQVGGPVIAAVTSGTYDDLLTYTWAGCINAGCYTLTVGDTFGDGLAGTQWFGCGVDGDFYMIDDAGNLLLQMGEADFGSSVTFNFCVESPVVPGCTDETACNYNELATQDDGSCILGGCEDPYACNYMENPGCILPCDYESCDYSCPGDFNDDGIRGTEDLLFLLGVMESTEAEDLIADLDQNGIIGTGDWLNFLELFGTPCPE